MWQVGTFVLGVLLSYSISRHFDNKSANRHFAAVEADRIRARKELAEQLAKQMVKRVLADEQLLLGRERVWASLGGKFKRTNILLSSPTAEDVDDVLMQTVSVIEEQEFVDGRVKDVVIGTLMSCFRLEPLEPGLRTPKQDVIAKVDRPKRDDRYLVKFSALVLLLYLVNWTLSYFDLSLQLYKGLVSVAGIAYVVKFNQDYNDKTAPAVIRWTLKGLSFIAGLTVLLVMTVGSYLAKGTLEYEVLIQGFLWSFNLLPPVHLLSEAYRWWKSPTSQQSAAMAEVPSATHKES